MKPEPYIIQEPKKPAQLTGKEALDAFDYMNAFPQETGKLAVAGSDRTYPIKGEKAAPAVTIPVAAQQTLPIKEKETPAADKGFDYDELHRRFEAAVSLNSELASGIYQNDPKKEAEITKQVAKLEAEYRQMADSAPIPKVTTTKFLPPEIKPDEEVTKPEPPAEKVRGNAASEMAKGEKESEAKLEVPIQTPSPQEVPEQTVPVRTGKGSAAGKEKEKMTKQERRDKLVEDLLDSAFGGSMKPTIIDDTPINVEKETTTSPKSSFLDSQKKALDAAIKAQMDAMNQELIDEMNEPGFDPLKKRQNYDELLANYKPTWFQDNTVEAKFGKRSEKDTKETKQARGAALAILKSADDAADSLKDWFSKGKGHDMLRKSVAEDLAWEKGIDVKDVSEKEIFDATFQLIANRTAKFQNAKLDFNEVNNPFLSEEFKTNVAGFVRDVSQKEPFSDALSLDERKLSQDPLYRNPSVYRDEKGDEVTMIPRIDFPESYLRKYFADRYKPFHELKKKFDSGKISKEEWEREQLAESERETLGEVASHEVSHLADMLIPRSDLKFIKDIVDKRNAGKKRNEYLSDPYEILARIRALRGDAATRKQISGDKSDFTQDDMEHLHQATTEYELIEEAGLTWEDIVKIANKVSVNEPKKKGKSLLDVASNNKA